MRRPGDTDLDIWIHYPGEGDADQRANNRIANAILWAVGLFIVAMIGAGIAGAWS